MAHTATYDFCFTREPSEILLQLPSAQFKPVRGLQSCSGFDALPTVLKHLHMANLVGDRYFQISKARNEGLELKCLKGSRHDDLLSPLCDVVSTFTWTLTDYC
jgi:hypothetical protein